MTKFVQIAPDVFVRVETQEPTTIVTLALTDADVAMALESGGRTLLPDLKLALLTALACGEGTPVT